MLLRTDSSIFVIGKSDGAPAPDAHFVPPYLVFAACAGDAPARSLACQALEACWVLDAHGRLTCLWFES